MLHSLKLLIWGHMKNYSALSENHVSYVQWSSGPIKEYNVIISYMSMLERLICTNVV